MASFLRNFLVLVLCFGIFFEKNAQSMERPRPSWGHHSGGAYSDWDSEKSVSAKPIDWAQISRGAEMATAALSVPTMAAYRYSLLRYAEGKRAKKPIFVKSLLSGLRVLNGVLTLCNQGATSNNIMRQRYTALWVIIDLAQFFANTAPSDTVDTIYRYFGELSDSDTRAADDTIFATINEFLNNNEYAEYLRNYVLPALEEYAVIKTAFFDGGAGEEAQKTKLYAAGVKGVCRCLQELLDTDDIRMRKFYIWLLVGHLVSLGLDVVLPDTPVVKNDEPKPAPKAPDKPKNDDTQKGGNTYSELEAKEKGPGVQQDKLADNLVNAGQGQLTDSDDMDICSDNDEQRLKPCQEKTDEGQPNLLQALISDEEGDDNVLCNAPVRDSGVQRSSTPELPDGREKISAPENNAVVQIDDPEDGGDVSSGEEDENQSQAQVAMPGNPAFNMKYQWAAKKIRKEFDCEIDRLKNLAENDPVILNELDQLRDGLRSVDLMAVRSGGQEKNWIKVRENELAPYEYILRDMSERLENNQG